MECVPLDGNFGAAIEGLDLRTDNGEDVAHRLMAHLYRHRFLVIRNQQIDESTYSAFGHHWGAPLMFYVPSHRDNAHPELIVIHNRPDTPPEQRDGAMQWHVDSSYEERPAATTMLYAVEAPDVGNQTMFCDMVAAYAALPPGMKARIEDLVVAHGTGIDEMLLPGEYRGRRKGAPDLPLVHHPLVMTHPVTGERSLYAPTGSARGIVGMPHDEAIALLLDLKRHAIQPRFQAAAAARTRDILIWDNYAVMHAATPTRYSDKDGERRFIYRYSTRDTPHPSVLEAQERQPA